jgi:hypothetical protein
MSASVYPSVVATLILFSSCSGTSITTVDRLGYRTHEALVLDICSEPVPLALVLPTHSPDTSYTDHLDLCQAQCHKSCTIPPADDLSECHELLVSLALWDPCSRSLLSPYRLRSLPPALRSGTLDKSWSQYCHQFSRNSRSTALYSTVTLTGPVPQYSKHLFTLLRHYSGPKRHRMALQRLGCL